MQRPENLVFVEGELGGSGVERFAPRFYALAERPEGCRTSKVSESDSSDDEKRQRGYHCRSFMRLLGYRDRVGEEEGARKKKKRGGGERREFAAYCFGANWGHWPEPA